MKLAVIIPAYNEEKTIESVICAIPQVHDFAMAQALAPTVLSKLPQITAIRIFVVNNGSTDKTLQKVENLASNWPIQNNTPPHKIEIISLPANSLAKAFMAGVEAAITWDANIIVNIDADGQYLAEEIPKIIQPILNNQADFVIGDRQVHALKHMPLTKKYGNIVGSRFIRTLTGLKAKNANGIRPSTIDASSGFRAFTTLAASKFQIQSTHTYTHENLIQAHYLGLRIRQIPITFIARKDGGSRLISGVYSHIFKSLSGIWSAWRRYRF